MIEDDPAVRAAQFIIDSAEDLGTLRANRAKLEHMRKHIIAVVGSLFSDKPLGVQEREAHAGEKYRNWLESYHDAVLAEETLSAKIEGYKEFIRVWQTQQANARGVK